MVLQQLAHLIAELVDHSSCMLCLQQHGKGFAGEIRQGFSACQVMG
jgi:hypothetical protein